MRSKVGLALAVLAACALAMPFTTGKAFAQSSDGNQYCRLLDDDGDGIPNCLDPDYTPPQDGTGYQFGRGEQDPTCAGGEVGYLHRLEYKLRSMWSRMFGGGISQASGFGPGDGTGYDHDGPHDGTGYGAPVMTKYKLKGL